MKTNEVINAMNHVKIIFGSLISENCGACYGDACKEKKKEEADCAGGDAHRAFKELERAIAETVCA